MNDSVRLAELIEQINYGLSLKFKNKWRHRFSEHFVQIFQNKMYISWKNQRPLKLSALYTAYRKYKYSDAEIAEFLKLIEIEEYYPIVYEDKKYLEMKRTASKKS